MNIYKAPLVAILLVIVGAIAGISVFDDTEAIIGFAFGGLAVVSVWILLVAVRRLYP